jgi:hypothetical protein
MKPEREEKLQALLSGARLSGPARDRVLSNVLGGTAKKPRRWMWAGAATAGLAMAAVVLLLVFPPDGFRSRGSSTPIVEVGCVDGTLASCPRGSALLFRVSGAKNGGFLSAWTEPSAGGERIWYFPTSATANPAVAPTRETQTLPVGVRIGPEQQPGAWTVHLVLSKQPLSHEQVLALPAAERLGEAHIKLVVK